jgi:hypothetical protein
MPYLESAEADHLRIIEDESAARAIFKRAVRMVEIEVFSYCNRICWFCPNRDGSRRGANQYMDETLYLSVLAQLASINYDGMITYSRYNEPLADRIILRRLEQGRNVLPRSTLHANTNGDYLTRPYLDELFAAGLRSLNVQIYLQNDEQYDHEKIRSKSASMLSKLGLPFQILRDEPGEWLEYHLDYPGMTLKMYARNFATNGCNRGDTVDIAHDYVRTAPCVVPFWAIYVDHNGSMMPCCNVRSDVPEHQQAIIELLDPGKSIFLAFSGKNLVSWRRSLLSYAAKTGLCRTCRYLPEANDAATRARIGEIWCEADAADAAPIWRRWLRLPHFLERSDVDC